MLHTHRSITTAVRGTVAGRSVKAGGVYLLPFPMCHITGYNMLVHHAAWSTVLPVATFRPDAFVEAVKTHGVTSCSLAPTMLHGLLAHLEETGAELPTLRDIAYGSAAIPADLLRRALARLDVGFHQGYGMTETGGNVTFLGPVEHRAGANGDASILASAGRPHDEVDIRIDDDGEILVRGAQVAAAGENVSSREVEDVLSTHPDVDACAVVGVPDEYWGEAICVVVVARPGHRPSAESLIAHVRFHLAAFKRPRHVLFVDVLPLTSNGKIAKDAVRQYVRVDLDSH